MTLTYDTVPDLTEHVFRSVRGWLHRMYPDADILIARNQASDPNVVTRPGFRLEMVGGPVYVDEDTATGFRTLETNIQVYYQGTDVWDAQRVAGKVAASAQRPGRIPLTLYNIAHPGKVVVESDAPVGGTLPAALDIAVSVTTPSGATQPSERLAVAPGTHVVRVEAPHWPSGWRSSEVHLWAALPGETLRLQETILDDVGLPSFTLAAFNDAGAVPPNQATTVLGGLRFEGLTSSVEETNETEGHHDASIVLRLCTHVPLTASAQVAAELAP